MVDPPAVLTEDELRRLLRACDGPDFCDRRDSALIWFFLDTGCRLDEVTRLNVTDLDLDNSTVVVLGKGGRKRMVGLGRKSARAMDRYLRIRHRQPNGQSEVGVWLGSKGRMTHSGIAQVLEARGLEAKLARGLGSPIRCSAATPPAQPRRGRWQPISGSGRETGCEGPGPG